MLRGISVAGELLDKPLQLELQEQLRHFRCRQPGSLDYFVDMQGTILKYIKNSAHLAISVGG
jgi:hypothetical protein